MLYRIPNFQRPYVWGQEQIYQLLDDVAEAYKGMPEAPYFLGSVVLHTETQGTYNEHTVLDGQQRLTTLYLIHAVVRDHLATDLQSPKAKELYETCHSALYQDEKSLSGLPGRSRLHFAIREEVQAFIDTFVVTPGGTRDLDRVNEWVKEHPNTSVRHMAEALGHIKRWLHHECTVDPTDWFMHLWLKVVVIYVASRALEDAFRLFTVLNDRGVRLRNSDILKARNLEEVPRDEQDVYSKKWEMLEDELGEDFDAFLGYVRSVLVQDRARQGLLKEFDNRLYKPKGEAEPVLRRGKDTFDRIGKYHEYYLKVFELDGERRTDYSFGNLVRILSATSRSDIWIAPLLAYYQYFKHERALEFLVKLDNKFSADWIMGLTPTRREQAMYQIIRQVEQYGKHYGSSENKNALNELLHSEEFGFDGDALWEQLNGSRVADRSWTKYVLRKVDYLRAAGQHTEAWENYTPQSVEHVLPYDAQPGSTWHDLFSNNQREEYVGRLGNLVLIDCRKTARQRRQPFDQQKERYFQPHGQRYLNTQVVIGKPQWDFPTLKAHHEEIMALLRAHYGV